MLGEVHRTQSRVGGHTTALRHNGLEYTAKARRMFRDSFLAQVPENLPEPERRAAADALRSEFYRRLQVLSAKARRANRERRIAALNERKP